MEIDRWWAERLAAAGFCIGRVRDELTDRNRFCVGFTYDQTIEECKRIERDLERVYHPARYK